jgi:hypothetical protein
MIRRHHRAVIRYSRPPDVEAASIMVRGELSTHGVRCAYTRCLRDLLSGPTVLIHGETDTARSFYLRLAKFEAGPTDLMHLLLLMKDLRRALSE